MTEKWRRYETLMIFDPELGTEATEELVQKARGFVTQEEGRITKTERWGLREMAFELKGRTKGYYLLLEYAGLPRASTEMDRRLNLIDTVLKFQTILLEDQVDPASVTEEVDVAPAPAAEAAEEPAEETAADEEASEQAAVEAPEEPAEETPAE